MPYEKTVRAVACQNASGEGDIFVAAIDNDGGDDHAAIIEMAKDEGYEGPFVVFNDIDVANIHHAAGVIAEIEKELEADTSPR